MVQIYPNSSWKFTTDGTTTEPRLGKIWRFGPCPTPGSRLTLEQALFEILWIIMDNILDNILIKQLEAYLQWPFQDPKLEVPIPYKAYFLGLCNGISPQFIWPQKWYQRTSILGSWNLHRYNG